jgi:hypothetical protein
LIDQRNVDVRSAFNGLLQAHRGINTAESPTYN